MERLLKDHLVECEDENGTGFSLTCTLCGSTWQSREKSREAAVREAGDQSCICHFCGHVVCEQCIAEVGGIQLCVRCAAELKAKLAEEQGGIP